MKEGAFFDRKQFLAVNSPLDLKTVCQRLQERFVLPEFVFDSELEGRDFWGYAHSAEDTLAFNVTRIGRFVNPSSWYWMWGAPARANFQVIVYWSSPRLSEAAFRNVMAELVQVFEAEPVPYPDNEGA